MLDPFGNYCRSLDEDLELSFIDDEIAVLGINTARAMTFQNGPHQRCPDRIDPFAHRVMPPDTTKIIVTDHPFDLPDAPGKVELVGRARPAIEAFLTCGVDLLLAGHFHTSHAGDTSSRHDFPGYAALAPARAFTGQPSCARSPWALRRATSRPKHWGSGVGVLVFAVLIAASHTPEV